MLYIPTFAYQGLNPGSDMAWTLARMPSSHNINSDAYRRLTAELRVRSIIPPSMTHRCDEAQEAMARQG
jgi:hypothetical protein